jgi:hypothetical protein
MENENEKNVDSDSLEEEEVNFRDMKKQFLKSFDENVNQNKEKIKQMTSIFQRMDEIFKKAKNINGDIKNMEQVTQSILEKQHKDYINTFISFMDNIRKDLTAKLEEMEKLTEMKKKANDIRIIKCERDFFRSEAVRLNGICKSFKEKIDELTFNGKLLTDELNSLKIKWKESENINKQLLFELESNIQSYKELEQKFNTTQSLLNEHLQNKKNRDTDNINMLEEEFRKSQGMNNLEEQLMKTRIELKKEKERANKASANLNKFYLNKNKYETIFQNCVEETKKIIFNRRVKENRGFKIKNRTGIGKYDYKVNYSTKFENFLPSDKLNTLENFLFNEEVFNMVKEIIFSKPKKKVKNIENTKNIINSFKYFEPDWKMKEIVENANDNGDNILLPKMPLINHGRSNSVLDKKNSSIINNGNHGRLLNIIEKNGFGSTSRLSVDLKVA